MYTTPGYVTSSPSLLSPPLHSPLLPSPMQASTQEKLKHHRVAKDLMRNTPEANYFWKQREKQREKQKHDRQVQTYTRGETT